MAGREIRDEPHTCGPHPFILDYALVTTEHANDEILNPVNSYNIRAQPSTKIRENNEAGTSLFFLNQMNIMNVIQKI